MSGCHFIEHVSFKEAAFCCCSQNSHWNDSSGYAACTLSVSFRITFFFRSLCNTSSTVTPIVWTSASILLFKRSFLCLSFVSSFFMLRKRISFWALLRLAYVVWLLGLGCTSCHHGKKFHTCLASQHLLRSCQYFTILVENWWKTTSLTVNCSNCCCTYTYMILIYNWAKWVSTYGICPTWHLHVYLEVVRMHHQNFLHIRHRLKRVVLGQLQQILWE